MDIGELLAGLPAGRGRQRRRYSAGEHGAMFVALVALPTLHFALVLHARLYHDSLAAFVALPAGYAVVSFLVAARAAARRSFRWAVALGNVLLTLMVGAVASLMGIFGELYTAF